MDTLEELKYFASTVYAIKKPEFLETMRAVSKRALEQVYPIHGDNITVMTANYSADPEAKDFAQYVSQTAWNILNSQGYTTEHAVTYFTEMWTQEHKKYSSMEHHIHGVGAQISAFYFLDCPPNGCKIMLHDPRPGKVISTMHPADATKVTDASTQILLTAEPGVLVFANAWLPHGFSRNMDELPFRFIHMNLAVAPAPQQTCNVEVV
jgi:hypothetical protein